MSVGPPAAKGTMMVIGRLGKAWAEAIDGAARAAAARAGNWTPVEAGHGFLHSGFDALDAPLLRHLSPVSAWLERLVSPALIVYPRCMERWTRR